MEAAWAIIVDGTKGVDVKVEVASASGEGGGDGE